MGKTGLRSKACVVSVAVAASLGMAGMGLVSDGIVAADTTSVTDTINVTVQPSCTFNSVEDKTYAGSAVNGAEVNNFNELGIHDFNLFCNDNNGYIVTATAYDLEATGVNDVIAYTDNYTHTGVNGMWTAVIASDMPELTVTSPVPIGGGTIISSDSHTTASGANFTATYSAYVGTATPAGTYTGTIVYTLTASGTSNSNSGNSGNSGDNGNGGGAEPGNEVTDNSSNDNNGGGTGDSGTGGTGTGDAGANTDPGSEQQGTNNTPSNSPLMLSNSSPTYSTSYSYNTTNNYSGGGTSTLAMTNTQGTTGGDSNIASSNGNNDSVGVGGSYEKPLGVTTSTTSMSDEESGIDWVPIVVAGAALAVAGVAVITTAQSKKEG